jgi:integrase
MSEEKKVKKPKPVKCQTVEPIRDLDQLEKMKQYLYIKSRRDYCLFVVGINSGLRVSDLLKLKVEEVKNADFIRQKFI